jgi:hypothetical protein
MRQFKEDERRRPKDMVIKEKKKENVLTNIYIRQNRLL